MRLEHRDTPVERAEEEHDPVAAYKRRQQTLAAKATEEFDVPGYEDLGGMVAVYKRLDPDDVTRTLRLGDGSTWERCAQFLLDACVGVYRREDDELVPMWPASQTIRPSEAPGLGDFNTIFDMGLDSGPDIVLGVFQGNAFLVEEHADDVHKWMTSAQRADDEATVKG